MPDFIPFQAFIFSAPALEANEPETWQEARNEPHSGEGWVLGLHNLQGWQSWHGHTPALPVSHMADLGPEVLCSALAYSLPN